MKRAIYMDISPSSNVRMLVYKHSRCCIPTCPTTISKKYLLLVRFTSNEWNWNMFGFKLHIDLKIVPTIFEKFPKETDHKRCTIAKQVGEHFMLPMRNLVLISFSNNLMFDIISHVFFRDSIYILNEWKYLNISLKIWTRMKLIRHAWKISLLVKLLSVFEWKTLSCI